MNKRLLTVLAVTILPLTGCISLPDSGDPQAFTIEAPAGEPIGQSAFGPRVDSAPDELILDFLRACAAGTSDNFATARQYLMPSIAYSWNPLSGVLIYPTDKTPTPEPTKALEDTTNVTLRARIRANLDGDGIFAAADDSEAQVSFTLEKNSQEQWRISDLENGILLSQSQFESVFQPALLYFLATDRESLVPDPRWYPKIRLASYLIEGLILGPSSSIAPAVHSAFEPNVRLPTQGVEIEDGIARVDLTGDLLEGEAARELISLQINATLDQLPNISDVQIRLNSVEIPNAEVPSLNRSALDMASGLQGGALVVSQGQSWSTAVSAENVGDKAAFPTSSPVQPDFFAWLDEHGTLKTKNGTAPVKTHEVQAVSPPVIDRWGWVWVLSSEPGQLQAVSGDGHVVSVPFDEGNPGQIDKFVISADGVRAAFLKKTDTGNAAFQTIILRKDDGSPLAFGEVAPVADAGTNLQDISWAGSLNLVVLENMQDGMQMGIIPLSSFSETASLPANDIIRITAGSSPAHVFVQAKDQTLYTRVGAMWRRQGDLVKDVRYPG